MKTRLWWLCALCVGCAVPRSGMLMMGADRLGKGGAEVGLAAGMLYSGTSQSQGTVSSSSGTLQFPLLEANARIGLNEMIDVNLHASPGGIAPGVKIGYSAGAIELAALPSIGLGVYRTNATTSVGAGSSGSASTVVNVEAGLRLMGSLEIGAYFGTGYWFQYTSFGSEPAGTGSGNGTITGHNIGFNFGWQLEVGPMRLRPEIAFALAVGVTTSSGGMSSSSGNPTYTIMPAITIAVGSEKKKAAD